MTTAPSMSTEAGLAKGYPSNRFNERERQLLLSVKTYVDSLSPDTIITAQGDLIVGDASGLGARLAKGSSGLPLVAGASTVSYAALAAAGIASDAVTTAKILNANVTLAKLAAGVAPSHIVKFAGKFTTLGGDANEQISVPGVVAGDIVFVSLQDKGGTPRTILTAKPGTDVIDMIFSGDPSTDHIVSYQVLRAAS
jgi:hypothetical protein